MTMQDQPQPSEWRVEDIARFLDVTPQHARDRLTKLPDFPAPIVARVRRKAWAEHEVRQWARKRA